MPQKIEISAKTIVFTVVFLILLQVLWINRELIYALFLAFIFMSALKPAVIFLSSKKIPRPLAIIVVFVGFFSLLSLVLSLILPPLITESFAFFKNLPDIISKNIPYLSSYFNSNAFNSYLPNIGQNIVGVVSGLLSNIFFIVSVFFFTFYFLLDENLIKNLLKNFFSDKHAEEIMNTIAIIQTRMGSWVWAEFLLMVAIGGMTYLGLTLLGVRYALPLAIIAGLLEVLPLIGPIISAVPAFLVGISTSWFMGFSVLALFFIIQQIENNAMVPLIMKKTVGINPLLTLIALTTGAKLGGLIGAFIAIPLALLCETILAHLLRNKK